MGSWLDYRCPACHWEVAIGGPIEFYRAPDGSRRPYGHPVADSPEAEARGVDGFAMRLWCAGCSRPREVVTVEFEAPVSPLDAWSGRGRPKPGFFDGVERCETCASELSDEIPGPLPRCPECAKATLESRHVMT